MAKLKKSTRRKAAAEASASDLQAKAEQLSKGLAESAQHVWLAGVGAFQRAQHEGSKLFDALVKEGSNFEATTRKLATGRVDAVRDAVEERVGTVRDRAVDTWDRLEKVFEERVQRALTRLGVPTRDDLVDLNHRVEALNRTLRQRGAAQDGGAKPAAKAKAKPAAKAKAAAKPKASTKAEPAAKKSAVAKKSASKPASRPAKSRAKAGLGKVAAPDAPKA